MTRLFRKGFNPSVCLCIPCWGPISTHTSSRSLHPRPAPLRPPAGIAWDPVQRRLFVTGKYWPRVFQIVPWPINTTDADYGKYLKLAQSCVA